MIIANSRLILKSHLRFDSPTQGELSNQASPGYHFLGHKIRAHFKFSNLLENSGAAYEARIM
jgi:hypothetical protein